VEAVARAFDAVAELEGFEPAQSGRNPAELEVYLCTLDAYVLAGYPGGREGWVLRTGVLFDRPKHVPQAAVGQPLSNP
jgi:hypothetical protein